MRYQAALRPEFTTASDYNMKSLSGVGRRLRILTAVRKTLDQHFDDASSFQLQNLEAEPASALGKLQLFADFRQAPKATQHVAGQGAELVGIVLQALKLQRLLKIMHVGGAVHDPAVVAVCMIAGVLVSAGKLAAEGSEKSVGVTRPSTVPDSVDRKRT